jgi:hypothetical protein
VADVAFIGQVVYLPVLMHQMSRDTIPDHIRGITDDHLISYYILPLQLIGDIYLTITQEILPELLEVVPLEVHREMCPSTLH